jgi:zinc transport system permease protein
VRANTGCAVLMISHELHVVMSASDRVICLNGHVCCEGTPEHVASAPEYRALFGTGTGGALALYRHDHDHDHDHDHARRTITTMRRPSDAGRFHDARHAGGHRRGLRGGPLGSFVVWRRMAYFGDATAHAAILGVALSLALQMSVFAGAVAVALAMALTVTRCGARLRDGHASGRAGPFGARLRAGRGVVPVGRAHRPDGLSLRRYPRRVARRPAVIWGGAALVVGLIAWRWSALLTATLNEELAWASGIDPKREQLILTLALAITVAVAIKVVGVLLIAAMLIIPAAAARPLARTPESMALIAAGIGAASAVIGLRGAYLLDTPAGPSIVCVAEEIRIACIAHGLRYGGAGGAALVTCHAGRLDPRNGMHHAARHPDFGDVRKARIVAGRAVDHAARIDGRLGDSGLAAVEPVKAAKAFASVADSADGTDLLVLIPMGEGLGGGIGMGRAEPVRNRLVVFDLDFLGIERTGFGDHERNDRVFAGEGDVGHVPAPLIRLCDADMSGSQGETRGE